MGGDLGGGTDNDQEHGEEDETIEQAQHQQSNQNQEEVSVS